MVQRWVDSSPACGTARTLDGCQSSKELEGPGLQRGPAYRDRRGEALASEAPSLEAERP